MSWSLVQEQETAEREQIAHLDFDPRFTCEHPDGCERRARWDGRCKRCGQAWLACSLHHELELRAWSEPAAIVACPTCRGFVPGILWRLLFAFTPLGSAS